MIPWSQVYLIRVSTTSLRGEGMCVCVCVCVCVFVSVSCMITL